jgi:NADH:ubiquinone oxidoreductase subunit F (NADH-binding)/ferredoxin
MSPKGVIDEILKSGLQGRGGAGFSTGLKWKYCQEAKGEPKYIICNADEGDPGAFMDRTTLEGDPHSVIEGLIIAAYAIGASKGYVYVRVEYPLAILRLRKALKSAKARGFLGDKILGSAFSFDIEMVEGAGAFVCGEETALMASIMGKRGVPRPRPPYPATSGVWGKPTTINNVKTLATVPIIINNGSEWFSSIGNEKSKGTAVFALTGNVNNSGLVEVPMGTTLRKIIFEIGGGIPNGKEFKAVQTGGPSGGCIPSKLLDLPADYESLGNAGSIMGSGGMVVMDDGDLEALEQLASAITEGSLCGLGQTASNPVLTTIRYFRDEYEAHIKQKECPAKICKDLISYVIDPEACIGCTLCAKNCPTQAITGEVKKPHYIDQSKCITCGVCYTVCPTRASAVKRVNKIKSTKEGTK